MINEIEFSSLVGKTITSISASVGHMLVKFSTSDGASYRMWHEQECFEEVQLEDIAGDLSDLIGTPILKAEESTNNTEIIDSKPKDPESWLWTFYRISTIKGTVVLRWLGESNGFYSEGVTLTQMMEEDSCTT